MMQIKAWALRLTAELGSITTIIVTINTPFHVNLTTKRGPSAKANNNPYRQPIARATTETYVQEDNREEASIDAKKCVRAKEFVVTDHPCRSCRRR